MKLFNIAASGLVLFAFGSQGFKSAEEYEIEEWEHFMRTMEIHAKMAEAEKMTSEELSKVEPDNGWLKTCSGWMAQELCSTVFGSGLSEETAWKEDIGYIPRAASDYWMNYEEKSVVTSCKFFNPLNMTYKSIYREGIGCTIVERLTEEEIRAQDLGDSIRNPPKPLDPNRPWPEGEGFFPELIPEDANIECIESVVGEQFANRKTNPRAIVVIYKGRLIFERYARNVKKENRLLGWSATKSLTQTLIGIVVGEKRLDIYKPAPVPEWSEDKNDPRQNITVDMMLRMSSGTRWVGDIGPTTQCLFYSDANCAHTSALKPLVTNPDTEWNYNSGSSYILSRIALENRGDPQLTNFEWPKQKLFYPIGAHSMYIEYQPNKVYLGGGYGYGTARDWARFGLLHLRGGVWIDGRRILPEGWTDYSSRPSPTNNGYAAHFWRMPSVDERLYFASGFRNQNVYIFPNQDLIIVRMAMPPLVFHPLYQPEPFLRGMLSCFPSKSN